MHVYHARLSLKGAYGSEAATLLKKSNLKTYGRVPLDDPYTSQLPTRAVPQRRRPRSNSAPEKHQEGLKLPP